MCRLYDIDIDRYIMNLLEERQNEIVVIIVMQILTLFSDTTLVVLMIFPLKNSLKLIDSYLIWAFPLTLKTFFRFPVNLFTLCNIIIISSDQHSFYLKYTQADETNSFAALHRTSNRRPDKRHLTRVQHPPT